MDRRTFLALFLTAIVIVLTPMLFRGFGGRRAVPPTQGDTVAAGPRVGATASATAPLLRYRIVRGGDTLSLDTIPFRVERSPDGVTFTSGSPPITLRYQFANEGYLAHVTGQVGSVAGPAPAQLLIDLPPTI